ncbi:MAG: LysR family transcriptional regulator [Kofleriaceae bacterium]
MHGTHSCSKAVLDVGDLELVLAIAQSGSTVRASASLHLTQSAVSRGLLAVEDKLGTKLFERQARGLALTAAGRRFVGGAGGVLAKLVELEQNVRSGSANTVPLRVVCECYTAYRWLPAVLATLQPASGLEVTVAIDHTDAPVKALLAGEVDVALLTTGRVASQLLEEPLFADEIVFVVSAKHPLAARAAIGIEDLEAHPLIGSTATPVAEQQWFVKQVFGRRTPRVERLMFPLTEAVIDAARAGMGIAPMSEWVARPYVATGDLVAKRFRGKRLHRPWRLAYRRAVAERARQLSAVLVGAPPRLLAAR